MSIQNERLTILSEAEQAALYDLPDFDDEQRLHYLNLSSEEQALAKSRANLAAQVHCAIQISYFKAKHMFFSFDWDEIDVQDDINFVMQEYFPGEFFQPDGDRYEFWIYRQMKKRLKAGELYLADSVRNRSLQQEINSANEKGALEQPLDISALKNPIKKLLDDRIAELHTQWM